MMTSKMTKSNVMGKAVMSESGMMNMIMRGSWRVARGVTMLVLTTICLVGIARNSEAAPVQVLTEWSSAACAQGSGTGSVTCTGITIPAGSNRLLVVAITDETTNGGFPTSISGTYGTTALTEGTTAVGSGTARMTHWIGYLKEADLATEGSGKSITVNYSGGTSRDLPLNFAVYGNVEQGSSGSTIQGFDSSGSDTSIGTCNLSLNALQDGMVVYAQSVDQTSTVGTPTNYTKHYDVQYTNHRGAVGSRLIPADGTQNIGLTLSPNDRNSCGAIAINPVQCTPTGSVTVSGGTANGDPINVCGMYSLSNATLDTIVVTDPSGPTELYNGAGPCTAIPTTTWPDGNLDLTVNAIEGTCGGTISDTAAAGLTFSSCVATEGPFDAIDGSILSGATTDITMALDIDPAYTIDNIKVWEVTGSGGDINVLEKFEEGGLTGWSSNWTAAINDGTTPQTDPPGNGDLQTGTFTRSENTGPTTTPNGAYLFYEASVGAGPAGTNDRYIVNNNVFDSSNNQLAVEFEYNMNGADIGTLELQAQNSSCGGGWQTVWTLSGDQGDVWTSERVDLYGGGHACAYDAGNTELRFKFIYGGGPLGDIAINEVRILGPRGTGQLLFDDDRDGANSHDPAAARTDGSNDGNGTFPVWPEGTIRIDITGTDDCGGALSGMGFATFQADYTKPTVDSFNLPFTSLSPVPVYSFTGSDNIMVAGYAITEDVASAPSMATVCDPGNPNEDYLGCWHTSSPLKFFTPSTGAHTYYAWVKDGAGNVSDFIDTVTNADVTVDPDVTAPVIGSFTMPSSSFSPINVLTFGVTDDSGVVTGYMVTTSAVAPLPGDGGWLSSPPSNVSYGSAGSTDFYAWAKDGSGNVSGSVMATVDVLQDTNPPIVSFTLQADNAHDALTVPVELFTASDITGGAAVNTGVAAYLITSSAAMPSVNDPGWSGTPQTSVIVADETPHTFYAWAKDNSGNISASVSQTVTVTLPTSCVFEMDPGGTLIQTEKWTAMGAPNPWAWDTIHTPLADTNGAQSTYPDTSYRTTAPDPINDLSYGGYIITAAGGTGSTPNGSRADYPVFFPSGTEGQWCIWIRGLDQSGSSGGDSNFWGIDGGYIGAMTQSVDNGWAWTNGTQNGSGCTNISVNGQDGRDTDGDGNDDIWGQWHTINLWPREQGQKNDMFYLYRHAAATTNAYNAFTGNNDQTTVLPRQPYTEIDPTCVDSGGGGAPGGGGGSGFIAIPDGQSIVGSPIDIETMFTTDLGTPLEYRALGEQTDGFEHQNVDPKWFHSNIGNEPLLVDTVPMVEGQGYFKLAGSGTDIWNNNDQFAYHYQPNITGDFTVDVEVKALLDKQTNTTSQQNASAKAGIMVRQSLSTNSSNVMMLVTSDNGARLQRRQTNGGTTTYVNGTNNGIDEQNFLDLAGDVSAWLRLRRTGNIFEGFYSTDDGVSWISVGTTTVSMSGAINVGLAVTSHNTGRDSIGSFDNFLFMPSGPSSMTESWTSTATGLDTTLPAAWTAGTFGLSVRDSGSGTYAANTFDYDSCSDTTPSTLSVHSGATTSGSSVSLADLISHTGNVGGFTYEINGNAVTNPWNSFSVVPPGSSAVVSLKVTGTDPDCSGTILSDTANINIDNTCSDPTPSTITILTGQVVGGPNVDLTQLFSSTGNVADGGLTFKIDGTVIGDPTNWDSRQFGASAVDSVSLEIHGVDPDCGVGITAVNNISVDNGCTRNFPSISFDRDLNHVGEGRAVPYTVTIRNEDSFNCGPSTYQVNVLSDSNLADFNNSYFNPVNSNDNIVLQGRETFQFELAVEAVNGATEWAQNVTTLEVTSNYPGHNAPKTTGAVTTKVFLVSPITHNSVSTNSTKWGGSWGTTETGSRYGNFTCLTCHDKGGPNIKWMRGDITVPADSTNGATWGISGQATLPITFRDARSSKEINEDSDPDNTVYWGHDDWDGSVDSDPSNVDTNGGVGRNASNRVCEVCHSTTWYHRYDTQTAPNLDGVTWNQESRIDPVTGLSVGSEGLNHFPDRDCTDCHRHSLGFTASCTGCHGDPPLEASLGGPNGLADIPAPTGSVTPGTHYKHTVVLGFPCEYCHAGWRTVGEMPKEVIHNSTPYQDINHNFNTFFDTTPPMSDPVRNNGHYTGQDGVSYEGVLIQPGDGTMTCENIYCHGGTESMGGTNPQWNGNIACNSCHGTSATNTPPGYSHTTHVGKMGLECTVCHYTGGQDAGYNGHVNGRVNLEMNVPGWQALTPMYDPDGSANLDGGADLAPAVVWNSNPNGDDMPPSSQYGTCLNVACHFGNETPPWNNNDQPATCTTCHNDGNNTGTLVEAAPSSGWHEEHVHPSMAHMGDPNIAIHEKMIGSFVNGCESCHGGGANTGDHAGHVNLQVDLGGGMTYSHTAETCTSQCHDLGGIDTKGTASYADDTEVSITWMTHNPDFTLACESCHAAPYLGPTVVDPNAEGTGMPTGILDGYGSHLRTFNGQTLDQSTSWTVQCRYCHPYHADESNASYAEVPVPDAAWDQLGDGTDMAEKLGLQFPVTGAIHLGGTGTSGTTEAQICWNCHDANSISEWDTNTKAATGSMTYNYGSVTTSNWTTATWTSAVDGTATYDNVSFAYKTAPIQSTHAASTADGAVNGVDPVAAIRCTYCHDVHDRNRAKTDVANGITETLTGMPYLRGTWLGNPYKEDGAPQSGTIYNNYAADMYGAVPRGSANPAQKYGGYWIDQNSGDPMAANSYDDFGGICQLCHGSDINTLNQYGANGAGWVSGLNGHANSVKGGSGVGGNIFTNTDRGGGSTNNYNGGMGYWGFTEPGNGGGGMRGADGDSFAITPATDSAGNEPCANDLGTCNGGADLYSEWDDLRTFDVTGAANNSGYHTFSCSKCHNPHASRLPKLMITNCLDTKHNSWDDNVQAGNIGVTVMNNTTAAAWTTAQNCHRVAGINDPQDADDQNQNSQGSGWNLATPWTDTDAYGSGAAPTQDNTGTW